MKTTKNLLSFLLAICLMLGLSLPAFAATGSAASGKTYRTVTVIGDSLATGYMIQKSDGTYVDHTHGKRIRAAWTSRVAEAVGAVEYNNYAREGTGTNEILRLLDPSYEPDEYFRDVSDAIVTKYYDGPEQFAKYQKQIKKDLRASDLVLLNGGSNDLFATVMTSLRKAMAGESQAPLSAEKKAALAKLDETVSALVSAGEVEKAWAAAYQTFSTLNMLEDLMDAVLECAVRGYMNFQRNWGRVATKIHEINPDATVVVISLFNGTQGLGALPGTGLSLGNALDPVFDSMNARIRSFNAVTHYYTFIDITGVEHAAWPSASELLNFNKFYDYMMLCTHPTKNGHKWIAKKVLKAI